MNSDSPVHEGVLEERRDCVDVVLAHLADVLEQEAQRLENTVLHVELGHAVLVHQAGQDGEWGTSFGNNCDGDCRADPVLSFLHFEVVQKSGEHVVGSDGLGDVTKCVDGGSSDRLLVRLQQFQQLKANPHPLSGRNILRT